MKVICNNCGFVHEEENRSKAVGLLSHFTDFTFCEKCDSKSYSVINYTFENILHDAVDNKKVLDVCCGAKGMWFDKHDERVLYLDQRREYHKMVHPSGTRTANIDPDEIMNFTDIKYPDNSFYMVVMDPPHIVRENPSGMMTKQYGCLTKDWKEMLRKGFIECFRVLKPNGTFILKWCESDIPLKEILELTNEKPLFGHKSGKHLNTHWVCFIKS